MKSARLEKMGGAICSRLEEKGFTYKYEHFTYRDAGHTMDERWMMGGTFEGNKKARIDLTGENTCLSQRI